jgi:hypothetical protein
MHTVELLDEAVEVARLLGFKIQQDWLGGEGTSACWVKGRKWLMVDLAQSYDEQLGEIAYALRGEIQLANVSMTPDLAEYLDVRRVA